MTDIQNTVETATKHLSTTSESALLDAEVLLCHVLNKPRSHIRAWPEKKLTTSETLYFDQLIEQRHLGFPIAYIVGTKEFWSRDFIVNSDVLIPRPDTELLIELSLQILTNKSKAQIIDLGTGSGIIAITLAAERPDIQVFATDLSEKALHIAQKNAQNYQLKNLHFIQSDWFKGIANTRFDMIISNPPYIKFNDPHLAKGDVRFEPKSALVSASDGLQDIKKIATQAQYYLKSSGTLLIEHGYDQKELVETIFKSTSYQKVQTHQDLSGNPRVTAGQYS